MPQKTTIFLIPLPWKQQDLKNINHLNKSLKLPSLKIILHMFKKLTILKNKHLCFFNLNFFKVIYYFFHKNTDFEIVFTGVSFHHQFGVPWSNEKKASYLDILINHYPRY